MPIAEITLVPHIVSGRPSPNPSCQTPANGECPTGEIYPSQDNGEPDITYDVPYPLLSLTTWQRCTLAPKGKPAD
jgi:hypothetical protein